MVHSVGRSQTPRLVASDLDGTLLRSDGSVSSHTAAVWAGLSDLGVQSLIVTARPPRWLHHLDALVASDSADAHGLAICAGGAFVYDVAAREVLERTGFTPQQAREVLASVESDFPGGAAAFETDRGAFRTPAYSDATTAPLGGEDDVVVCELSEVPDDAVVGKILVRHPAWIDDAFVPHVTACVGAAGELAYSGAVGLAEIMAPGVTKSARLASWCEQRGIDARDVWAFGDMPNDLPMLMWAGRGVAVANAHADVLAAADDECGTNEVDGVARYLAQALAFD